MNLLPVILFGNLALYIIVKMVAYAIWVAVHGDEGEDDDNNDLPSGPFGWGH